ncbi:MAG: nucleotidyltransferase domain-containing protein [Deltaproteobacteria bacterium]|nr:nucleotidyltransferase domain-containing protein [Deltaproteobacteria bacterium]
MVDAAVVAGVRSYLRELALRGVPASFGVVFGSYAAGRADKWSDIDLLVVSPLFDGDFPHDRVSLLWRVAARTDNRIEPIPCGEKQWAEDQRIPIIEIARREGVRIDLDEAA